MVMPPCLSVFFLFFILIVSDFLLIFSLTLILHKWCQFKFYQLFSSFLNFTNPIHPFYTYLHCAFFDANYLFL